MVGATSHRLVQVGGLVLVSVGRCAGVDVCAWVLLRCVFDGLSHVGAQNTRFSGFFLRLEVKTGHLSASSWSRCTLAFVLSSRRRPHVPTAFTAQKSGIGTSGTVDHASSGCTLGWEGRRCMFYTGTGHLGDTTAMLSDYSTLSTNVSPAAKHSLLHAVV